MAPTTHPSAPAGAPVRPDAALPGRGHGAAAGDRVAAASSPLAFRPDPAALLAQLDRAPRSCRQVPVAGPVRDRSVQNAARCGGGARLVLLVALMLTLAIAWSVAGWVAGPGSGVDPVGAGTTPEAQTVIVVQPGDTLWSIAEDLDPDGDLRATVDRLADRNGGSTLTVGQRLVVSE
ncbi:MAG: LysM peptidoglycan-binding domain-containing protein [Acidimicrobiales bacterium]